MKERLVGAAVLVAIGAWLIPWVLDGPEQVDAPTTRALELPVPAADAPPARTETIVLEQQRDAPLPNALGGATVRPAERGDTQAGDLAPAPAEPPPAPTPARAAATPSPSAPEHTPAAAAPAAAEAAPADMPGPGGTRWYVQLGAFGDQGNAERLAARVATYGFDARVFTAPSGGGTVHRVRIGPQPSRERAEAIASSLSAHGFVAQVAFE